MGLILVPSEIIGKSTSVKTALSNIVSGYQNVLTQVSNFANDEALQSDSWTKLKEKVLEYHTYIEQGMLVVQESVETDLATLEGSIGSETLDEDELINIIDGLENEKKNCEEAIEQWNIQKNSMAIYVVNSSLCSMIERSIEILEKEIENLNELINTYKEKLEFLYTAEDSTKSLLDSAIQLLTAMSALISEVGVKIMLANPEATLPGIDCETHKEVIEEKRNELDEAMQAFIVATLETELGIDLNKIDDQYKQELYEYMENVIEENGIIRVDEESTKKVVEMVVGIAVGCTVKKVGDKYQYTNDVGMTCELSNQDVWEKMKNEVKIMKYMDNLSNSDSKLLAEKKETLIYMGKALLREGYEVAFVAGILGNIVAEGDVGKFESSAYDTNTPPDYIEYINQYYNYRELYSGKNISQVGINETQDFINKLNSDNSSIGKFGLGCVQWTEERTGNLLICYKEVCGEDNHPTTEQCLQAETLFIITELEGDFNNVYSEWKNASRKEDSLDCAKKAGRIVCELYEKPKDNPYAVRAANAGEIYSIMMK